MSKAPGTVFGLGRRSEICIEVLLYWPVQIDRATGGNIEMCGFQTSESSDDPHVGTTLCGNSYNKADQSAKEPNPVLDDKYEATSVFGQPSEQCRAVHTPTISARASETSSGTSNGGTNSKNGDKATETAEIETGLINENSTSTFAKGSVQPSDDVEMDQDDSEEDDEDTAAQSGAGSTQCFSGRATVQLSDGRTKQMDELNVGDEVLVSGGVFSNVFMFGHKEPQFIAQFIRLHFDDVGLSMALTFGHIVPIVGSGMRKARDVSVGDALLDGKGRQITVTAITKELDTGLYNPHTIVGDIVVDGVLVSTFTDAVEPLVATALLTPLRWIFSIIGADMSYILV